MRRMGKKDEYGEEEEMEQERRKEVGSGEQVFVTRLPEEIDSDEADFYN